MADVKPAPPPRSTTSSSNAASQPSAVRYRLPQRQATVAGASHSPKPPDLPRRPTSNQGSSPSLNPTAPELPRRRSSIISDATSYTGDLLSPSTSKREDVPEQDEVSHWHSTPLAFALLPAIGGLLFQNGSAFVTDILLLGLAAIFMNWSIRIPWDWYYSAQSVRKDVEPEDLDLDLNLEEHEEMAVETESSADGSPQQTAVDGKAGEDSSTTARRKRRQQEAAAGLRRQELLALFAAFAFPALAAYLLHVIRAQLSRPSTSLVSDYNLSIFLLAAEVRPARQLVRLMANRTLHLQRTVNAVDDPFASSAAGKSTIDNLTSRIAELETKLSDHSIIPSTTVIAQKADVTELSAEMRKRYEPRLDGLERAVRRYEKRSTTLAMLTEQRLDSLESRLQDALSLAAVAAQHSQRRGMFAYLLETLSAIIALPIKLIWSICVWPFLIIEDVYERVKVLMLGPAPSSRKVNGTAKRSRHGLTKEGSGTDEKQRAKGPTRKIVR